MAPKLSANAATETIAAMHASIATIVDDMRKPLLSTDERYAINARCKGLFVQWAALQDADAETSDIMTDMITLFENYVNLMPLSPTTYCAMH